MNGPLPPDPSALPCWLAPRARRVWALVTLGLALAVCWLAFAPVPPPEADLGWDKANHLLAFAALGGTAALSGWTLRARRRVVAVGLLAFGGFIELVQSGIPGRSGEWHDLLADAIGIAIGLLAVNAATRHVPAG